MLRMLLVVVRNFPKNPYVDFSMNILVVNVAGLCFIPLSMDNLLQTNRLTECFTYKVFGKDR